MIIYKITNKINDKVYIGQTRYSLPKRWSQHKQSSKLPKYALHHAFNKYGIENFIVEEIAGANSLSELNYLEQHYIYKYNSISPNGYNLTSGGQVSHYSEDSRNKMSESGKIKKFSETHKKNLSLAGIGNTRTLGYKATKETKKKMSLSQTGRKHSEETKIKISKTKIGRKRPDMIGNKNSLGKIPWNKGLKSVK